ncbi:MAG: hypothetical protein WCK09_21300, partial [Bacteroidota bacterium]
MVKCIFIFISIFISAGTSAQSYFNQRFEYGQPGWWDGASSICQLNDGYLLGGPYQYYSPHCVGFYKMDFQGNKIISKTYCEDTTEYFLGFGGSIAVLNSDSILAVGESLTPTATWEHDQGVLFFLNKDLDILSIKQFGEESEPFDTAYLFTQLKLDSAKKNIIITGIHYPNSTNGRASMLRVKTDRNGNLIWKRHYGSGLDYEGYSVICTNDGGYAIGGYSYGIPIPPDYSGDPVLVKTDSAGNQQWILNLGGQFQDSQAFICNSMDGNIIVGTSYCDSMPGGGPSASGNAYRRINIIKVDNNGNILWNKKYGPSEMFNQLWNIRENSDGSLIACGATTRQFPTTYDYAGWMLKTNSEGDSLWYRQYVVCGGGTSWNWLYNVIQTDDNGFIAGGIVYTHLPDTGSCDGWVLKVDSLGCENPSNCWVGIRPETEMPGATGVKIFPNPAENLTTINLINGNHEFPVRIKLFDVFGREVTFVEITQVRNDIHLDVTQLPEG